MAKQTGSIPFSGTIGIVNGYQFEGKPLLRKKRKGKRGKAFKKDKRYAKFIQYSDLLKDASSIVKFLYKKLPVELRKHGVYGKMTGMAMQLLRKDYNRTQVEQTVLAAFLPPAVMPEKGQSVQAGIVPIVLMQERQAANEHSSDIHPLSVIYGGCWYAQQAACLLPDMITPQQSSTIPVMTVAWKRPGEGVEVTEQGTDHLWPYAHVVNAAGGSYSYAASSPVSYYYSSY